MKICTFNVNSIRVRKDLIMEWINHRGNDLDVLCFQELKAIEDLFPFADFERVGFHCEVSGQKTYNGVAICSRQPLENVHKDLGGDVSDEQKRFIAADIAGIRLINIYAPHGGFPGEEKYRYKQGWYARLTAYLKDHYSPEAPLLMVGDFNVAREDTDVYDPAVLKDSLGTLPEERAAFEKLINWGFIDIFREWHPDSRHFTWWDYIGGAIWKDEGMRIDYGLCTQNLIKNVESVEVDLWPRRRRQPKPSDHAPLIITLTIPE